MLIWMPIPEKVILITNYLDATEQKLERLKEQILTDVKEMKGLDKEREDIFREIHEHERKKQISLNELYQLKRNREELEKKNVQLSDIVKQHVNRDSGKTYQNLFL